MCFRDRLLVFFLLLVPLWLFSQSYTVEYLTFCENDCITIGPVSTNPAYTYCWQKPHTNINIADVYNPRPEICGLTSSASYYLKVTDVDGMIVSKHYYHVYPKKVDLVIHHATVLTNGTLQAVADGDEENIGAMIPVNLDNDDLDINFDINDVDVSGGDNEFALLKIRISPASILTNTVQISSLVGTDNTIKIWKTNDKTGGEYTLGDDLVLNKVGDDYVGELWIEGVLPHIVQQQTKLELISHNLDDTWVDGCVSDKVSLTVIGVEKIEWIGIGNGFESTTSAPPPAVPSHESNVLDLDPKFSKDAPSAVNSNGTPIYAHRVFPGKRSLGGSPIAFTPPKDKVELKVTLTVLPPLPFKLYLRAFDIDDPINDTAIPTPSGGTIKFIDPNDDDVAGVYSSGTGIAYSKQEDNRGTPKFGQFDGEEFPGIKEYVFSLKKTLSKNFKVSHFPGDNYRVAANCDLSFVQRLRNYDHWDDFRITDPKTKNTNAKEVLFPDKYLSDILTVWRILHVEYDVMKNYPIWEKKLEFNLQQYGEIVNFVGSNGSSVDGLTTGNNINDYGFFIFNGSNPIEDHSLGDGRFEGGNFFLGKKKLPGAPVLPIGAPNPVKSNTSTQIILKNKIDIASGLSFELKNGSLSIVGNLIALDKSSSGFKWTIDPVSNLSSFLGGKIRVGGGSWIPINGIAGNNNVSTSTMGIGYILRDDDRNPGPNLQKLPTDFNAVSYYTDAYILYSIDGGGDPTNNSTTFFYCNLEMYVIDKLITSTIFHKSFNNRNSAFWIVYALKAWQGESIEDWDPEFEPKTLAGITYHPLLNSYSNSDDVNIAIGGMVSAVYDEIFHETPSAGSFNRTVAHEIGHQFGLGHGLKSPLISSYEINNWGIMTKNTNSYNFINPRQLNLLRCRVNSPGNN